MAVTQQRVIRSTLCLVLGLGFLARIALFNLTAQELHELYYDRPTSKRGIGQTSGLFEHVSCFILFCDWLSTLVLRQYCKLLRKT